MHLDNDLDRARDLAAGALHYRAYVGPPERYDLLAALQFNLLTSLGLGENHTLLDIGCGSCRAGRLFIPYLLPERYFGLEPEQWLIEEGIDRELGRDVLRAKRPSFDHDDQFTLTRFGRTFDFLLAQSVFSHTSASQLRRCLDQARQVMRPESIFVANYKLASTNYTGEAWVYPQCAPYTAEFFAAAVRDAGLHCVPIDWPHPGLKWVVIVLPGRERMLPVLPVFPRTAPRLPAGKLRRFLRRIGFWPWSAKVKTP